MFRVYLDWNVFSYLRQKGDKEEPFISLQSFLNRSKERILLVYSPAHLQDLKRSYFQSEKGKIETEKDLEILEKMTDSHCLYEEHKGQSTSPMGINPKEYFSDLLDNDDLFDFDFENLISEEDDPKIASLWKSYIGLMKLMPSGIDLNELDKLPKKYQGLKKYLSNTSENNSFYSLIMDVFNLMKSTDKEQSNLYKTMRNSAVEDMKINTNHKEWGNPFEYLNSFFEEKKINKTFQELIDDTLNSSKKKEELTRFDYFINYYISLDTFGYYRDKKMSNLIDDATHAYYGAYCDYFVTNDDNTYNKAKAVYEKFGIKTEVCKAKDFTTKFYSLAYINPPKGRQDLIDEVIYILNNSFLLTSGFDDEMNYANIYKIERLLLDYFNRMQFNQYEKSNCLYFYKRRKNYSNFYFWTEIENLINRLVENLGVDLNMRGELTQKDKEEINKKEWAGRIWGNENYNIEFYDQNEPFGWTLKIETFKKK